MSGRALAPIALSPEHVAELREAKQALEGPRFAIQVVNLIGVPIEQGITHLPANWREKILSISHAALERAADIALWSVDPSRPRPANELLHKLAVTGTGAVGGAFGLTALALELPVSTTVMLRSIADIARAEGEDLRSPDSKLACLTVFALGGRSGSDDASESAYYVARMSLASAVSEAAHHLMSKHALKGAAPPLHRSDPTNRRPIQPAGVGKSRSAGGAGHRRRWRRGPELVVHQPLSADGKRSLHDPQTRTAVFAGAARIQLPRTLTDRDGASHGANSI